MKLCKFFLSILAGAALAAGCAQEQEISSIPEFKVEKSYLGIELKGGIVSTAYTATAPWSFDAETVPSWLTISPMSGSAGSDHIVFAADTNPDASERVANLLVSVAGRKQRFTVVQEGPGAVEAPISTIAEVAAGNDGTVYRIRGTVTVISNTNYGNLYIQDETGTIYIYGLFNAKGQYPKDAGGWATFGVESGDVITVQGPRTLYNGTTLELVDATLISVEKSLIEVDPSAIELESAEAGTFTVSVVSKANGMAVLPSAEWIRVTDIAAGDGDAAVYTFAYDANTTTAARTATIQFKATNSSKSVTVTQPGIPPTGQSVTEIVALADNSGVETLESVVVAMTTKGFVISDATTAIYVYDNGANPVELGDAVKVFATKTTYNGVPELATVTAVENLGKSSWSHPAVKNVTADALTYEASVAEYIQFIILAPDDIHVVCHREQSCDLGERGGIGEDIIEVHEHDPVRCGVFDSCVACGSYAMAFLDGQYLYAERVILEQFMPRQCVVFSVLHEDDVHIPIITALLQVDGVEQFPADFPRLVVVGNDDVEFGVCVLCHVITQTPFSEIIVIVHQRIIETDLTVWIVLDMPIEKVRVRSVRFVVEPVVSDEGSLPCTAPHHAETLLTRWHVISSTSPRKREVYN